MKSSGWVPTDPVPHSLVRDCLSCKSRFSLSVADFDNNFSMSKAAICSKLSVGLEVRSKIRKKETFEWMYGMRMVLVMESKI